MEECRATRQSGPYGRFTLNQRHARSLTSISPLRRAICWRRRSCTWTRETVRGRSRSILIRVRPHWIRSTLRSRPLLPHMAPTHHGRRTRRPCQRRRRTALQTDCSRPGSGMLLARLREMMALSRPLLVAAARRTYSSLRRNQRSCPRHRNRSQEDQALGRGCQLDCAAMIGPLACRR